MMASLRVGLIPTVGRHIYMLSEAAIYNCKALLMRLK